jgi:hypothetical protein
MRVSPINIGETIGLVKRILIPMKQQQLFAQLACVGLTALLVACASPPSPTTASAQVKPNIEFIDLANFDRDLNASLGAKLGVVDVAVVNSTTATAIPQRLQAWLQAVEAGGGTVKVSPPQSSVTSKNPFLLLSLVSGVWNSIKVTKAVQSHEMHKPARAYNAEIILKIDDKGERLIDKITSTD